MNKQKVFSTSIVLAFVVLIALGAVWQPAAAGHLSWFSLAEGKTVEIGKQGIAVTKLPHSVTGVLAGVIRDELPARFNHGVDIQYRAPAMEVRFVNANGGTVERISSSVYIFFNIGKAERSLWFESGSAAIAIWYYNELDGQWQKCPTYYVNENRDNGMYDRLSCIAPGSGYYVLGHVGFDELLFNPYTTDNERVVDIRIKRGMQ